MKRESVYDRVVVVEEFPEEDFTDYNKRTLAQSVSALLELFERNGGGRLTPGLPAS